MIMGGSKMLIVHKKSKILVCMASMLWAVLVLTSCSRVEETINEIELVAPVALTYAPVPVKKGNIQKMTLYDTYVIPYTEELAFERDGVFSRFHVRIGDKVKQGQILAELDNEDYLEQIKKLKDKIADTKKQYEAKINRMYDEIMINEIILETLDKSLNEEQNEDNKVKIHEDIITRQADNTILNEKIKLEKDLMEVELLRLQEELEEASKLSSQSQLVAPFDGEIISVSHWAREGYYQRQENPVIGIADTKVKMVTCKYISETDIDSYLDYYFFKDGKKYPITYVPYDPEEYSAIVLNEGVPISTFVFTEEAVDVEISDWGIICMVKESRENVLTVPIDAVMRDSTGSYVYVLENGKRLKRMVSTGLSDTISIEIVEGLMEGENVFTEN